MRTSRRSVAANEVERVGERNDPDAGPQRYWLVTWPDRQPATCRIDYAGWVLTCYSASTSAVAVEAIAAYCGGITRMLSAAEFVYQLLCGWAAGEVDEVLMFTPADAKFQARNVPAV